MSNPLKVLVDLQARRNVLVSGTLEVTGSTALAGGVTVTGGAVNASAVAVTASSLLVSNGATISGGLGVNGTTSLGVLSGSDANFTGDFTARTGSFTGDLTVTGNLTINGTTTNINTTNLVVEDKNIVIADVTTPTDVTADGAGITVKGDSDKLFRWLNATDSFTSSEHMDLASGKSYKINGVDVLTSTTLGSGVVSASLAENNSSLSVVGSLTASVDVKASGKMLAATTGTLSSAVSGADSGGSRNLSYAVYLLDQRIDGITGGSVTAGQITSSYQAVRVVTTGSISGDAYVELTALKAGFDVGSLDYISLDVVVKSGSTGDWQNDLVAVHLNTGSGAGSTPNTGSLYVTITALSEATNYRLIAVNEKPGKFTI
jgi:hypothetical protein